MRLLRTGEHDTVGASPLLHLLALCAGLLRIPIVRKRAPIASNLTVLEERQITFGAIKSRIRHGRYLGNDANPKNHQTCQQQVPCHIRNCIALTVLFALTLHAQVFPSPGPGGAPVDAGAPPSFPTPSSRWLLDEGAGTTPQDSEGTVHCVFPGSTNDPTWVTAGLSFDGDDWMECGTDAYRIDPATTAFTVCAVVQKSGASETTQLLAGISSGSGIGYALFYSFQADDRFGASIRTVVSSNNLSFRADNVIADNAWHHVCMAFPVGPTAATSEIYIDGSVAAETVSADTLTSAPAYGTNQFSFGRSSFPFFGVMGPVTIWAGTELSGAEIAAVCAEDETVMAARSVTLTCP